MEANRGEREVAAGAAHDKAVPTLARETFKFVVACARKFLGDLHRVTISRFATTAVQMRCNVTVQPDANSMRV